MPTPNFESNGNINVSCFVSVDATVSNKVIVAASGAYPIGISQEFPKAAPFSSNSGTLAAAAGDVIKVYGLGEICFLQATTAGWTAGDLLKPAADGSGNGATASTNDTYGAVALATVSGAKLGRVQVIIAKK